MNELEQREWARHYTETYIRARAPIIGWNEWTTCAVHRAVPAGRDGIGLTVSNGDRGANKELWVYGAVEEKNTELDTSFPKLGFFNYNGMAYYVERSPQRQWKRGFCRQNTAFHAPFSWETGTINKVLMDKYGTSKHVALSGVPSGSVQLTVTLAEAAYTKNFMSYDEAIRACEEGRSPMVAINHDTAVSVSHRTPNLVMWKGLRPVAEIEGNRVRCTVPELKQEVLDYFTRARRMDIHVQ